MTLVETCVLVSKDNLASPKSATCAHERGYPTTEADFVLKEMKSWISFNLTCHGFKFVVQKNVGSLDIAMDDSRVTCERITQHVCK